MLSYEGWNLWYDDFEAISSNDGINPDTYFINYLNKSGWIFYKLSKGLRIDLYQLSGQIRIDVLQNVRFIRLSLLLISICLFY